MLFKIRRHHEPDANVHLRDAGRIQMLIEIGLSVNATGWSAPTAGGFLFLLAKIFTLELDYAKKKVVFGVVSERGTDTVTALVMELG